MDKKHYKNCERSEQNVDDWFAAEVSYIQPKHYVGSKFYVARILNRNARRGERLHWITIVPVDEFYVATRDMGFEVVNLRCLLGHMPVNWTAEQCDLQLNTGRTNIDGPLDELILESKPLHDHIDSLYHYDSENKVGYAFNW